jgi:hypothetical protein
VLPQQSSSRPSVRHPLLFRTQGTWVLMWPRLRTMMANFWPRPMSARALREVLGQTANPLSQLALYKGTWSIRSAKLSQPREVSPWMLVRSLAQGLPPLGPWKGACSHKTSRRSPWVIGFGVLGCCQFYFQIRRAHGVLGCYQFHFQIRRVVMARDPHRTPRTEPVLAAPAPTAPDAYTLHPHPHRIEGIGCGCYRVHASRPHRGKVLYPCTWWW